MCSGTISTRALAKLYRERGDEDEARVVMQRLPAVESESDVGEDAIDLDAIGTGAPIKVFESPVAWLRGKGGGTCFLDDCEARWSVERYAEDEIALRAWWEAAA